jgi:hypothetical protein
MATINKTRVTLTITWDKDNPDDVTYVVRSKATIDNDTKTGGAEIICTKSAVKTMSRADFRALTGTQIEDTTNAQADVDFEGMGSGAGGHSVVEDTGN